MKILSPRAIAIFSLLLVSGLALPAFATNGIITGTVFVLNPQDTTAGNSYFELATTVRVGTCITDGSNHTLALIPDNDRGKQIFALVQSALLAGKNVAVTLDDTVTNAGYCFARAVTVSP
jgi:hypothetical protein